MAILRQVVSGWTCRLQRPSFLSIESGTVNACEVPGGVTPRRPLNKEAWQGGKNADKAVSSAVGQT
jgi:hypothetical protein